MVFLKKKLILNLIETIYDTFANKRDLCQAHWGLPVGFLLPRYSYFFFTVESLSLLYLLFISWFCSRRWCIDKLKVFHAHQTSIIILYYIYQTYRKICSLKLETNDQIPGASSLTMMRKTMKWSEMAQLVERKKSLQARHSLLADSMKWVFEQDALSAVW